MTTEPLCSPDYNNTYLDSIEFFSILLHTIGVVSAPIHIFGGFCILYKTPKEMSSVKPSLLYLESSTFILDLTLSIFCTVNALIPLMAVYPIGILTQLGIRVPEVFYILEIIAAMFACSVIGLFENRLFILMIDKRLWGQIRIPFLVFLHLTGLVYFYPNYITMPPGVENQKEFILKAIPCLHPEVRNAPLYLIVEDKWKFLFWTACETLLFAFTIVAMFIFIIKALRNYGHNRSQRTIDMQKKLIQAITLQLAIPFFIIFIPISYYTFSNSYYAAVNNIMYVLMATHGSFSTVVMIIVQKPYREFLLTVILLNRRCRTLASRPTNSVSSGLIATRMF
ncbi:Serpentine Receptor, class H [Caenorhabditis elegans]|uniref:Serpentine Receptor, class H n=1 Tax=Caenorhabditis elegans TaxID=6239 RepID=Q20530_CAEEL|nr:Serpentine Receptor, class H [Caenorhabditis elegans]CCD71378.1 Serpentine Receptor, class H [Caenorhabditis elegans]|eukprot:NP_500453.1 Serpentine Receptor, class H [Caenorhabditis elegans]